ncbi:MAG TPA: TonB-dependent receptor [Arachidicoccus sp.]|nr:TonB-dependent receptor [Arachidicoccus sp.]
MNCSKKAFALLLFCLTLLGSQAMAQNQKEVTGTVEDAKTHQPIAGASIQARDTKIGTLAGPDGTFTLSVPDTVSMLTVSYIGYSTREIPLAGQTGPISIALAAADQSLEEVVVVGYGTQKRVTITGSVASVQGTDLQKAPVTNLSNSLAGRLPGVTAVQASGEPGYDGSSIRIRGTNSLGNSDALIVIDGVPSRAGGLERLNPADIESVSVLKDASAAIYGSRAGNGVILITTKQGKSGAPKLTYDFSYGLQRPTRTPEMSDAVEYAKIRNNLKIYDNVPTAEWADAAAAFAKDGKYHIKGGEDITADFGPEDMQKYQDGSDPLGHPNTDWFGTTLKSWSPQQRHNVQLSGGSEKIHYLASLGYLDQDAYYKNSATGFQQYDMRINLEANINKYVKASLGVVAREEYRHFPTLGAGDIFRMLMRGKPTEIEVWPNGLPGPDIEYGQNPIVITTNKTGYDRDKRDYFQTNGKIEIKIPGVEGLKVTGSASIDKMSGRRKLWQTPWSLYFWDKQSFEEDGVTPVLTSSVRSTFLDPRLKEWSASQLAVNLTGLIDYNHTFGGDHEVTFLAGVTREKVDNDDFYAFRRYFISSYLDQLGAGGQQEQDLGNDAATGDPYGLFQRARLSYFGRVGYNYKEKYIAEFLWRSDGSYIFPPEKRFGFFPGVTAGWRISEENFWKNNISFINNFKLRGSWGKMGAEAYIPNTSDLAEYQYLATMGYGSYILGGEVAKSLLESRVNNPDFTWEVANNYNIGFDANALNNHLSVEFDYFYNKRTNILIPRSGSIPESSGITDKLPPVNLGQVNNKGWEFKVGYNGNAGEFHYNASVNGGYAKNKIVFWDETPGAPSYQRSTGQPVGSFLAYEYDGVFPDQASIDANKINYGDITGQLRPGDMKFKDVNGDGKITGDDKVRLDKTGTPSFTTGFNLNLDYKGFDMSVMFQGAFGGLQYIGLTESGDIGNFTKYAYDHQWTVDNPSTTDPRLTNRNNSYYADAAVAGNNTYWLKSNNYVRLKNMEIGYTLPPDMLTKAGISRLRVFVSGLNLITWDKIKIWDPESTSSNGQYYPQAKIINFGLSVAF